MPAGAVYVGRPSVWANPYRVMPNPGGGPFSKWLVEVPEAHGFLECETRWKAHLEAVRLYQDRWIKLADLDALRSELEGHDLVCWCPRDMPCHAEVLLDLANPGEAA